MYHAALGIEGSAVSRSTRSAVLLPQPGPRRNVARMQFLVDEGRRLGLLLGGAGTGKSLLMEIFARVMRRGGVPVAKADVLGVDRRELLWQIATGWNAAVSPSDDAYRLWRMVTDKVAESRLQKQPIVLLLDNADESATTCCKTFCGWRNASRRATAD